MSDIGQPDQPQTPPPSPQTPATPASGFDFNGPTIVSLLYLSSCILGVTAIVGIVLAYVWKGEQRPDWELTHYEYLIRTFWIGLIGTVIGLMLLIVLIGAFVLLGVAVLVVVRCVLSLINAQKRKAMPNPQTWLA